MKKYLILVDGTDDVRLQKVGFGAIIPKSEGECIIDLTGRNLDNLIFLNKRDFFWKNVKKLWLCRKRK